MVGEYPIRLFLYRDWLIRAAGGALIPKFVSLFLCRYFPLQDGDVVLDVGAALA